MIDNETLMEQVLDAIRTVYDPEIPVNIWELGLVYRVDVDSERNVQVDMTLTAPSCPVAGEMPVQVQQVIENLDAVKSCKVELVWEPSGHRHDVGRGQGRIGHVLIGKISIGKKSRRKLKWRYPRQ